MLVFRPSVPNMYQENCILKLGLCLGWYGQLIRDLRRRSSILQQPGRGRVATAAKPVAASRLWCAVPVKQSTSKSLGHHQNLTHCWHHGTWHVQSFIISHSSCAESWMIGQMSLNMEKMWMRSTSTTPRLSTQSPTSDYWPNFLDTA